MAQAKIYQIKITLRDSKPPIWRRLLVSGDTKLSELHSIIQEVMPWWDYHLHQFDVDGVFYSTPHPDDYHEVVDERKTKLGDIAGSEGAKFIYEYDFGDGWDHIIQVERILPPDPAQPLPVCIKGKRACPPEDVGGIWGYEVFLKAIKDPKHSEHDMYIEWIGAGFDPEEFDLEAVNERLRKRP
jgi:hypothetical protein